MAEYLSYDGLIKYDELIKAQIPKKVSDLTNDIVFPVTSVNGQTGAVTLTIPAAANNGTLTIQKNGTTITTFDANQSTDATANISVPTKLSELENDAIIVHNGTLTIKKNGSTLGTFSANQAGATDIDIQIDDYDLPKASSGTLGGVKIGANIDVDSNGAISLSTSNVTTALGFTPVDTDDFDAYKTTIEGSVSGVSTNLTNHTSNKSNPHNVTISQIGAAPAILYQTNDPGAGSSLATGTLLCVYEA